MSASGGVEVYQAGKMPTVHWPNGRWCLEANSFLLFLLQEGCSVRGGGSLKTYAHQLGFIVDYCFALETSFTDLTDGQFVLFMHALSSDSNRSASTNLQIGRISLRFLEHVAHLSQKNDLLGNRGQIRAAKEEKYNAQLGRKVTSWHHRSFPKPGPKNTVFPIARKVIDALKLAAVEHSSSPFLKMRRLTTLLLLEHTGCRRSELVKITTIDIRCALQEAIPMLKVATHKQGGNKQAFRLIPVRRSVLEFALNYDEVYRKSVIRQTCGHAADTGHLFISTTTGKKLDAAHIGLEIWKLKQAANIGSKTTAHMFRHRFATLKLVDLIENHLIESVDDVRAALVSIESFKAKLIQWTGHKSVMSLDQYVDLAFEEVSGFNESVAKLPRSFNDT